MKLILAIPFFSYSSSTSTLLIRISYLNYINILVMFIVLTSNMYEYGTSENHDKRVKTK